MSEGSMKIEVSQLIERPVAEVFHFYADEFVRNHSRWDPDMELEQLSDGPMGLGTVIRRRNTHTGAPVDGTMEIVEFDRDEAVGSLIHDGPVEMRGRATFEVEGPSRTRFTINVEILGMDESNKDLMTSLINRSARAIKTLVETEAQPSERA